MFSSGIPKWHSGKEPVCQCRRHKRFGFNPWVRKIPWRRKWQPAPGFLPGESHGQRNLVSSSPWAHRELAMTEHTHLYTGSLQPHLLTVTVASRLPAYLFILFSPTTRAMFLKPHLFLAYNPSSFPGRLSTLFAC